MNIPAPITLVQSQPIILAQLPREQDSDALNFQTQVKAENPGARVTSQGFVSGTQTRGKAMEPQKRKHCQTTPTSSQETCTRSEKAPTLSIQSTLSSEKSTAPNGPLRMNASSFGLTPIVIQSKTALPGENIILKTAPLHLGNSRRNVRETSNGVVHLLREAPETACASKRPVELVELNLDDYKVLRVVKNTNIPCKDLSKSVEKPLQASNPVPKKPRVSLEKHKQFRDEPFFIAKAGKPTHMDPCPVIHKLGRSKLGDQMYVDQQWERRPGECDPRTTRLLSGSETMIKHWLQAGMATIGAKVFYCDKSRGIRAEGWIANEGILCCRCGFVVGTSDFKLCAGVKGGDSTGCQLILSSGLSLTTPKSSVLLNDSMYNFII